MGLPSPGTLPNPGDSLDGIDDIASRRIVRVEGERSAEWTMAHRAYSAVGENTATPRKKIILDIDLQYCRSLSCKSG